MSESQRVEPPKKIYLQYFGADKSDCKLHGYEKAPEVTWCEDKIYDTDIEYALKGKR